MDAIPCLATPAALLSSAFFTDPAIARALHFSMSDSSAPSPLLADFASAPSMITSESVMVADTAGPCPGPGRAQQRLAPAGGRSGKRRSRASKRAPTTYISTDPANFRLLVQQITGVQAEPVSPAASVLLPAVASDDAVLHHHHQQQPQPCFPTLDSWSLMYEGSELL